MTHSTLEIDFFNFDWFISVYKEWSPDRKLVEVCATNSIFLKWLFVNKIIDLPGGHFNDYSSGLIFFSFVPPINTLVSLSKGFLS